MQYGILVLLLLGMTNRLIAGDPENVIRGTVSTTKAPHGDGNVYAPEIVRQGDTLLMYYGGQGHDGHDRIHLAKSTDHQSWTPCGVVFAPEGVNHVNDPSIVIVGDEFYMFYTRAQAGVTDCIGLAISADGTEWVDRGPVFSPREQPAWDSLLVGRPSVLHDGKQFRMWYDGRADLPIGAPDSTAPKSATSRRYVGYAESKDGLEWKRRDMPIYGNDAGGVHISIFQDHYLMFIESRDGTRWASSRDGISWQDNGLLVAKDDRNSPYGHVTPFLFIDKNKPWLYFGAAKSHDWNQNSIMKVAIPLLPFPTDK